MWVVAAATVATQVAPCYVFSPMIMEQLTAEKRAELLAMSERTRTRSCACIAARTLRLCPCASFSSSHSGCHSHVLVRSALFGTRALIARSSQFPYVDSVRRRRWHTLFSSLPRRSRVSSRERSSI